MENTGAAKRSDEPTVSAPSFGSFPQPALGSNPKQQSVQSRRPKASRTDAGKRKDVRGSRQHTEGEIRFSRIGEQRTHDHMAGQDFYTDRIGDKDALHYSTNASLTTARFRRDGGGRLLGLSGQYRAVNLAEKSSQGLEVAKLGQAYIPRYATGYRENTKRLRFRANLDQPDYTAAYLAVDTARPPSALDDQSTCISGPVDLEEADLEDHAVLRQRDLEKILKNRPDDVDAWIAFSKAHLTDDEDCRSAELEVSLAILGRALGSRLLSDSIPLHLEYLRVAAELWPTAQVEEAWKGLFRREDSFSSAFELRLGYLNWMQGSGFGGGDRNGDRVMAFFGGALSSNATEEEKLYIFTRACFFMMQMGYEEKAIGSFQALLDLTLANQAGDLDGSFDRTLDEYENHWDSDALKLGETGARGWKQQASEIPHTPDHVDTSEPMVALADRYQQWALAERRSAATNKMPAKMNELDMDECDPHRSVLFADIRSMMFPIHSAGTAEQLCWTFLHFLGLPLRRPGMPTDVAISNDPQLFSLASSRHFWPIETPRQALPWRSVFGTETLQSVVLPKSPVTCCATDRDNLWSNEWFRDVPSGTGRDREVELMRNGIQIIASHFPSPEVDMYALALEAAVSLKGAMKFAKSRLASDRNNLTLWAGYARLERLRGRTQTARAVYAAALSSEGSTPTMDDSPRLGLLADWALMEWTADEHERCLDLLVRYANGQEPEGATVDERAPISKMALLKARQFYSDTPLSRTATVLATLFAYENEPGRALDVLQAQLSTGLSGYDQEVALQLHIDLIRRHMVRHPGPPSVVRGYLEHAGKAYPDNTLFLNAMLSLQAKSGLHSRLHALTARLTATKSRLVGMVWAIWAEAVLATDLYCPGSGGASRVRSRLKRALISETGRQCPAIWLIAIEFEIKTGQQPDAKKLFYRAMAQIGTCKELYLIPFEGRLRPYFTETELGQIVETMMDRGIRLRCDPGDFWTLQDGEVDLPSDEEPHDDELRFLTERQAMRPY